MKNKKKPMWQFPWQYRESIAIAMGIVFVGIMLQLTLGNFNFFLLHSPANLIVGSILIVLIGILSFSKKSPLIQWLSSIPLSVSLLGTILLLTIIMGLVPQFARLNPDHHLHWNEASWTEIVDYGFVKLGFKQMTTSWAFVLIYSFTLLVLGLVIAKRLHKPTWRDYGFYLNHLGLWLLLFAAGLGSADMLRYVMYVEEGETEWRVFDSKENVLPLEIAIKLHDFVMEEYQPKLAVIDKYTGDVQPEGRPAFYQIDERKPTATLHDWNITLEEYIHEAVRKSDTTFQSVPMPGSMPAAKVRAVNSKTGEMVSGWLTCGSIDQFVMPLDLDSTLALVMTKPEAKRFASDITVMTKDESHEPIDATLEVNSPLTIGHWTIYQYDYDHALGKASRTSGFELVYDPWVNAVYVGIAMIALGSVCMLWLGNRRKTKNNKI